MNTPYPILAAKAAELGLPQFWKTDLGHDKADLERTGSQDFIWVLRTCGSHLIRLDGEWSKSTSVSLIHAIETGDSNQHWFHFSGGRLRSITPEQARELVYKSNSRRAA